MKVTITGQEGFIGYHLYNSIKYQLEDIQIINFNKELFSNDNKIDKVIIESDIIIHLAGINRSEDQNYLYNENINLGEKLICSIKRTNFRGKLIFASSIQEDFNNHYGKAKKITREFFYKESVNCGFDFVGLIIPNVFGPFCKPNYNSFISTFSDNLINGRINSIIDDKVLPLLYVKNLIDEIITSFESKSNPKKIIKEDVNMKVTEVSKLLDEFNDHYFINGTIPELNSEFKKNLFLTYISYIPIESFFPKKLKLSSDRRGLFSEIIRSKTSGQTSFSITNPNKVRGEHFHIKKIERFAVISGEAKIEVRRIGKSSKKIFKLNGEEPSYIDMIPWHTHNITNTGSKPLITLFWINDLFKENQPDTYSEKV